MIYKNYWRFSDTHAANTLMRLCLLRRQAESSLTLALQRRLPLTLCLSPDIYFLILTTVPGGRGCYRRVGRQGSRLLFPSLHSLGVISILSWRNSVASTPPFARVLPGRNPETSFSTIWWASSALWSASLSNP